MMRGKWMILVIVALLCAPGWAYAVSEKNFELDTTGDLVALCTAPSTDPLQKEAVNVCYGFLIGSYHYHVAEYAGLPSGSPLVCLPEPKPPRAKVLKMFLDWTKKHPEYMGDEAVGTWFRFLIETYPCKP
jgi:hypothetical protein